MNKFVLALLTLAVLPGVQAQKAPPQNSQSSVTLTCQSAMTSRNIGANLRVPAGATCLLNDTLITGNVRLESGATLTVRNTNVQGHLTTAPGFKRLDVQGSIVQGNLQAVQGGTFNMNDSQVTGQVLVSGNTGPIRLSHVTLNRNLDCRGNKTMPTGTWIRVDGRQLGQCARL